jgi:hypothetical protein
MSYGEFFNMLGAKITAFQSTKSGHLFRTKNLVMKTYNSHGNCFNIQLESISDLFGLDPGPEGYLDLHPNDQKKRLSPFSIRLIIWLVEEIEN